MKISKKELEKIYTENLNKKAAEILGISKSTLFNMIKRCGILPKGKGNRTLHHKIEII